MAKPYPIACIFASVLTIIAGIILLITASIYTNSVGPIRDGFTQLFALSIFSIIIGCFALLIPIGLIYVVHRQFPALTLSFSVLVVGVAIMAAVCGIILITGRVNFRVNTYDKLVILFGRYNNTDPALNTQNFVSAIQQGYQCCGYDMATDWTDVFANGTSTPDSCCTQEFVGCGKGALIKQNLIYLNGCTGPVSTSLRKKYTVLIGMNFAVVGIAIITAILGFIYERVIREQYEIM